MNEVTVSIEDLFKAVANIENTKYKENEFYNQDSRIEIKDENGNFVNVSALITKKDTITSLDLDNDDVIKTASNHLIAPDRKNCVFVKDINEDDVIQLEKDSAIVVSKSVSENKETVFDMTVDTNTHLYQTANGVVHHNTHTVNKAIKRKGLEEDHDYVVIKGFATPKALYVTLWENKEKTIIFDDCDSVLKDPTAINLLKGALDSYEKRTISWLQRGFADEDIPQSFEFKGQVIFISNINSARLDGAIKSRSIVVDLSMTMKDKIDRMRHILPKILPDHSMKIKEMALDFMEEHAEEAKEFNLRTLMKASKVIKAYGIENEEWKAAVKYLLVSV